MAGLEKVTVDKAYFDALLRRYAASPSPFNTETLR